MILNGTTYDDRTPLQVAQRLEELRANDARVRIYYGDTTTGADWGDTHDVEGRIGRSTGPMKVPLLIHNRRSLGGSAVLDHCIVAIRHSSKRAGGWIYRHEGFKV